MGCRCGGDGGLHSGASAAAAALAPWRQAVPGLLGLLDSAQSSAQAVTAQAVGSTVPGPLQGINFGFGNIRSLNLGSGNTGDTNVGSGNIGNTNWAAAISALQPGQR